jgi:ABC-type Fe3+-hydroxamate transport system substrate-binding protein
VGGRLLEEGDGIVGVTYAGEVYGVSQAVAGKLAEVAPIVLIRIAGEPNSLSQEQLQETPQGAELPAVAAGHVIAWNPEPPLTFEAAAAAADVLAAEIAGKG